MLLSNFEVPKTFYFHWAHFNYQLMKARFGHGSTVKTKAQRTPQHTPHGSQLPMARPAAPKIAQASSVPATFFRPFMVEQESRPSTQQKVFFAHDGLISDSWFTEISPQEPSHLHQRKPRKKKYIYIFRMKFLNPGVMICLFL